MGHMQIPEGSQSWDKAQTLSISLLCLQPVAEDARAASPRLGRGAVGRCAVASAGWA